MNNPTLVAIQDYLATKNIQTTLNPDALHYHNTRNPSKYDGHITQYNYSSLKNTPDRIYICSYQNSEPTYETLAVEDPQLLNKLIHYIKKQRPLQKRKNTITARHP